MFQLGSHSSCNYPIRDKVYRNDQAGHTRLVQRRCLQREDMDKSTNGLSWRAASMGAAAGAAIAMSAFGAFASEAPLLVIPSSSSVSAGPAKYVVLERKRVENLLTKEFAAGLAELTDDDLLNMLEDVLSSRGPSNAPSMWDRVTEYSPQRPVDLTSAGKQARTAVSGPPATSDSTSDSKRTIPDASPSAADDINTAQGKLRDSRSSGAVSAEVKAASPMIPSLPFLTPTPPADKAPTRQVAAPTEEATPQATAAPAPGLVAPVEPTTSTSALDPTTPANDDSSDASSQPEAALSDALTWVTSNLQQALQAAVPTADPQEQQPPPSSGTEAEAAAAAPSDQISSFIAPVSSAVAAAVQTVGPPLEEGLSAVRDRAADVWTDITERTASSSIEDPDMLGVIVGAVVLGTAGIAVLYRDQLEEADPASQDSQSSATSTTGSASASTPAQQQTASSGSSSGETKLAGGAANSKLAAEPSSSASESGASGSDRSRLQRLLDNGPVMDLPSVATASEETGLPLTPPPPPPPAAAAAGAFSSSAAEGPRVLWRRREEPAGVSSGEGVLWRRSAQPGAGSGASVWAARLNQQQQQQQQHGSAAPSSAPAWQANTALSGTQPASNSSEVYDRIPDPWKLPKLTAGQSAGAEQAGSVGGGSVSEGASDRGGPGQ